MSYKIGDRVEVLDRYGYDQRGNRLRAAIGTVTVVDSEGIVVTWERQFRWYDETITYIIKERFGPRGGGNETYMIRHCMAEIAQEDRQSARRAEIEKTAREMLTAVEARLDGYSETELNGLLAALKTFVGNG